MNYNGEGFYIEYTEGTITFKLNVRSNTYGKFEREIIEKFLKHCGSIFEEEELDSSLKSKGEK